MVPKMRISVFLTVTLLWISPQENGQAQSGLEFEVASVKPAQPGGRGGGIRPLPGGQTYIAEQVPVKLMIKLMFHLTDHQINGGPSWLDTDLYDVEAKAAQPSTLDKLHQMFQTLLVDRFNLKFHRELKEIPAYELVVDKGGSKMKLNDTPNDFHDYSLRAAGRGKMVAERESMSHFSWALAQLLDRPVMDRTGLDRAYDFTLEWAPEPIGVKGAIEARDAPVDQDRPSLATAVRQQLGLRLEPHKGPIEIFVIDSAEKPSAN
jgi:uncharacterized protein (TIGR03435 family)